MKTERLLKNCLSGMLSLTLCFSLLSVSMGATNKEISVSRDRISGNQEKLEEIRKEQNELKTKLQELNSLKSDTAAYIAGLDARQEELASGIAEQKESIAQLEENIRILNEELEACNENVRRQKEGMALRIRYMYETSKAGSAARVLESGSISELMTQTEYFREVSEFDRRKLEEFRAAAEECDRKQEELDSELSVMNAERESLEEQLEASEQLENEKSAELKAFEEKISSVNEQSGVLAANAGKLQAAIRAEEKKIAEIEAELKRQEEEARKKAQAQNKKTAVKSIGELKFLWPVPSSQRVTGTFGEREAPVEGASTTHKGIDIGASSGSEILAAEGGTVVIAAYSESAGNYVMISHGNGIYTVYMHMKEIRVGLNDSVKRGDQIGTVGSTGYSTGPHLHFGIRADGEYVDPRNYVSP